jgi:hypothetical protein
MDGHAQVRRGLARQQIFPPDGDVSIAGVHGLIKVSALIRAIAHRNRPAEAYVDCSHLRAAQRELGETSPPV